MAAVPDWLKLHDGGLIQTTDRQSWQVLFSGSPIGTGAFPFDGEDA